MSEYDGKYVKLAHDPAFWLVENGERVRMRDMHQVYSRGLLNVVILSQEKFEAIPIKGTKRKRKRSKADASFYRRKNSPVGPDGGGASDDPPPDEVCMGVPV